MILIHNSFFAHILTTLKLYLATRHPNLPGITLHLALAKVCCKKIHTVHNTIRILTALLCSAKSI